MAFVTCFLRLSSRGMLSIINNYPNQRQNIFCSTLTIVCPKHDQLFPAQGTAFTFDLAKQKDTYSITGIVENIISQISAMVSLQGMAGYLHHMSPGPCVPHVIK